MRRSSGPREKQQKDVQFMVLNSDSVGGWPGATLYSEGDSLEPYCEGRCTFPRVT